MGNREDENDVEEREKGPYHEKIRPSIMTSIGRLYDEHWS